MILLSAAANMVSVLILLELNAALDPVDHSILMSRLENWVGLSVFSLGNHLSKKYDILVVLRKEAVLVLGSFFIMVLLGNITREHNIHFCNYADDTHNYSLHFYRAEQHTCFILPDYLCVQN